MLVQVKQLLYWKTEHGNASNCQDALSYDPAQGLFAVADGASTSLFPALWAHILAQHFLTIPLMSDNPFEIEWWVRIAQTEYKHRVPDIHKTRAWNVQQKMRNQCSDATLATLRISKVGTATAQAMFLVFGDSCILTGNPEKQTVSSFILQKPGEFDRAPICVPSDLKYLNRDFHRCQTRLVTLNAGDQVIIATDAVARWILEHGEAAAIWEAFQEVYQCPTLDDWYTLVRAKRLSKEMVDDDSTALVLTFSDDSTGIGTPLGCTNRHTEEVLTQRKKAFEEAANSDNKELLAIAYGDGNDVFSVTTTPLLDTINIAHAREVANALKEVLRAFRLAQNSPNLVQKVKPVWDQYSHLLQDELCATNLRETLRKNGIMRAPLVPQHIDQPMSGTTAASGSAIPATSSDQNGQHFDVANEQTVSLSAAKIAPPSTVLTTLIRQQYTSLNELLDAYHMAKRIEPALTLSPQEAEMIMLAKKFTDAWNANDPYALTQAYRNINRSRFGAQIKFTSEEMEKCEQADNFVKRQKDVMRHTIMARVDEYVIPLENYIGTYIIKHIYMRYLVSQPPGLQPEAIEHARATNINQDDFPLLVLEELIDNILISRGILAIPLGDSIHQELETLMTQVTDELRRYEESQPDPQFRRYELGRKDLNLFARMIMAPKVFASYLHNQKRPTSWQKKTTLDDWLKEKREEVQDTIFFGETERYAYVDRIQILGWLKQCIQTYIY
jgi:hypothetical protein